MTYRAPKPLPPAILYAIFGSLWILFSSTMVAYITHDPGLLEKIEVIKGLLFVGVTSCLFYFIVREKAKPTKILSAKTPTQYGKGIFIVILAMLLLVPMVAYGILRLYAPLVEQRTYSELKSISELHAENILRWQQERISDFTTLSSTPDFLSNMEALVKTADASAESYVQNRLAAIYEVKGYNCLAVFKRDLTKLIEIGDAENCTPARLTTPSLEENRPTTVRIYSPSINETAETLSVDLVAPIIDRASLEILAYIITASYPREHLFRDIKTLPGHYESMEVLFLRRENNEVLTYHISSRDLDKARILRTRFDEDELARQAFDHHHQGRALTALDHHGNEVLAIATPITEQGWLMVTKIDSREALSEIHQLAKWLSLVVLCTLLAISVLLLVLWRQQREAYYYSILAQNAAHQKDLSARDAIYRELFDANPHPMWVYQQDNQRFLAVNDAAILKYGYTREEFLGNTLALVHPDNELATSSDPNDNLRQHQTRDGRTIFIELSSHQLVFEGKNAVLTLAYDVTERLSAEQKLKESDRFANATIDSLPMRVAVLDETGTIIATNRHWKDLSSRAGSGSNNLDIGANYLEISRKATLELPEITPFVTALENMLTGKQRDFSFEYNYPYQEEEQWFVAHFNRFPDDGPTRIVVSHNDITQRKNAERELKKLNRYYAALREMNAAIIRSTDADETLLSVCKIAAESGHFDLAWVSRFKDGKYEKLASYGNATGYLEEATADPTIFDRMQWTPGIEAVETGRTIVMNDVLNEERISVLKNVLDKWDLRSCAVCPIKGRHHSWGSLVLVSRHVNHFSQDLVQLLNELTADLAYALDTFELDRRQHEAQSRLLLNAKIIESSHEGMLITDADHRAIMINKALCDLTGYSEQELLGTQPRVFGPAYDSDYPPNNIQQALENTNKWEGEFISRRKDGSTFSAMATLTRVYDAEEQLFFHVGIYRDITQRKEYEQKIKHIATHDSLTNLPNRLLLDDRIEQAIANAQRHNAKVAVMFIDLDRFKLINDTLGHNIGDLVLKEISGRLVSVLRGSDSISRVGGDEFIVLLKDISNPQDAATVAEKIIAAVSQPCNVDNHHLVLTCSIGITLFPDNGNTAEGLSRLADLAMISAKQQRQGRYQFYSGEMGENADQYLALQYELRAALRRDQIYLVFQPQCILEDGRLVGVEALVRWRHHKLGEIKPERFIPIAEDSGVIVEIGTWILRQACRQAQQWLKQNIINVPISINVSAIQFRQPDFVDTVRSVLEETGLAPSMLELEVTESVLMREIDEVLDRLYQLNQIGVRLSIDDFGTGYSSLAYLRQFPADRLKIDKSFIKDLPESNDATAIASAIINLGSALNMEIIAEGVETKEQAEFLANLHCRIGQGFHFALPMEAQRFEQWQEMRRSV
jgi:diguanylate cyclase (GGDEF)-like protein/PAS domain S-box-containing protein